MGRTKILIPKTDLEKLYLHRKWSPAKIAQKYGCTSITIRNRLIEADISLKSKSAAQTKYPRKDFSGSDIDKAYLLGFKYGDLNAYVPPGVSETVVVRCHTTHLAQERLFKELFCQYGTVTISRNSRSAHLNCYLNRSFTFLLGKYPPGMRRWLSSNETLLWAFAAGYIDAEGTFGLNQGKGRFKIDAYDQAILADIHKLFLRSGIRSKSRIIARKGDNDYGWIWKQNVWRVSVNESSSLEVLIFLLKPFLTHQKRVSDANKVLSNIQQRRRNGTII
ncbi:MAG: LAGLIDADG family homing endonuclease [bacterium]